MSGVPGSGKSTVAHEISHRMGAVVLDNDVIRSIVLDNGVEPDMAGRVSYSTMYGLASSLLTQGFSVILDSPCRFQAFLDSGIQIAKERGACYRYIECINEDIAEIRRRLRSRTPLRSQFSDINNLPAVIESDVETLSGEERFRYWMRNMARPDHSYLRLDTAKPMRDCLIDVFTFLQDCA
jgi:predicted kinase